MIRPIDGNALLAQEKEWAKDGGFYTSIYNGFQKRIQDAPTLDYAPVRHGKWIEMVFIDTGKPAGYKCSECGLGARKKFAYCHCGALMDGDSNNGV